MNGRPLLCLVTDRRQLAPEARTAHGELSELERFLTDAIAAAVDLIQIRERDLDPRVLIDLTGRLVRRAEETSTRIVLNDRADAVAASGADGLHLRSDGPPADRVRAILPPGAMIGRSVHDAGDVRDGADYFIFGAVFPSGPKRVAGLAGLTAAVRATSRPVLAIGGVTPARMGECLAAGAAGIAAIGIFLPVGRTPTALGPAAAVAAFRAASDL